MRITLRGALDISSARARFDELRVQEVAHEVELGEVDAIDAAGLQLLGWLRARDPGRVRFLDTPQVLRETFTFLGLKDW